MAKSEENPLILKKINGGDFAFVQGLASKQRSFTVPSSYILWMLTKMYPEFCVVATDSGGRRVGYFLAIANHLTSTAFVWQIFCNDKGKNKFAEFILREMGRVAPKEGLKKIRFTMYPRVAKFWGIPAIKKIFGVEPALISEGINGEAEYEFPLQGMD